MMTFWTYSNSLRNRFENNLNDIKMETKPISPAQLKKVQTMFTKLGFDMEDKQGIISSLTKSRATSTKDITFEEAKILINYLVGKTGQKQAAYQAECRGLVKQIYHLSYEVGMSYGDTPEDKLMNCAKINKFCRERGTVKKNINEMNLTELKKTKKQFEAMLQNNLENAVKQLVKKSINQKVKAK